MLHNKREGGQSLLTELFGLQDGVEVCAIISGENDPLQAKTLHKLAERLSLIYGQRRKNLDNFSSLAYTHVKTAGRLFDQLQNACFCLLMIGGKAIVHRPSDRLALENHAWQLVYVLFE